MVIEMKKIIALILALLMCTLCFVSCGDKADEPANTDANDTTADTADAGDSDLAYIKDKGTMIIGITDFEPMDFLGADGDWTGFDAELAKLVCEKLGVTPIFQEISWDAKETELAGKYIDCIWNGLTVNADREAAMSMSDKYMLNKQVVVIREADAEKYTDLDSLAAATVAAESGSAGEDAIAASLPDANYIEKDVQIDALTELKSLTVDAAVLDYTMAYYLINKEGSDFGDLKILDIDIADEEFYAIAFRKGSDATANVNGILAELADAGTLRDLAAEYGLADAIVIG